MDDEALRKEIGVAFEYSYLHEDWVNPLSEALAGVTPAQALWTPKPGEVEPIWRIVLHVALWNENIVERIRTGEATFPPDRKPWPDLPEERTEEAWEQAKKRLWDSLALVKTTIETAPMEKILGMHYGLGDLFCRFNHIAYHVGQITELKELAP